MTHGQTVTLADIKGLTDANHWLGRWRVGFGHDVMDGVVGTYTHYVVDTLSDSAGAGNTLREALESATAYYITFDPALGTGSITMGTNCAPRMNKVIDGRGVRVTIAGEGDWLPSSAAGLDQFGVINLAFKNGGTGDSIEFGSLNGGTGKLPLWFLNVWFNATGTHDGQLDIDDGPDGGFYVTEACVRYGDDASMLDTVHILGNNRDDQNNHHSRMTMVRCAFSSENSYVRQRMPLLTDAHLESMENYRKYGLAGIQVRNNQNTTAKNVKARSRYDIWDGAEIESPTNNDPITIGNDAYMRVENAIRINDADMAAIAENQRDLVTDATIYVDESAVSISAYNDYTPGGDFAGLTDAQKAALVKSFAGILDELTLSGTVGSSVNADDVDGKTIILTATFDNFPVWSDTDKQQFIDEAFDNPGTNTQALLTALSPSDISVSGKVVTVTIPSGTAATLTAEGDETVRIIVPGKLMGGGIRCGPEDTFTIAASTVSMSITEARPGASPVGLRRARRLAA